MLNQSQEQDTNELGAQPNGHGQFWSLVDGPWPKACTARQFGNNSLTPPVHNHATTVTTTKIRGIALQEQLQMSLEWEWKYA